MNDPSETTMQVILPDGTKTEPTTLSALEEIASKREGLGQLELFEGKRYPDAVVTLAGGVKGWTIDLSELTDLSVGDEFHIEAHGVVAAKKHAVKYDEDGAETRTLTITLKADSVRAWDSTPESD